jgi:hypothetical protein
MKVETPLIVEGSIYHCMAYTIALESQKKLIWSQLKIWKSEENWCQKCQCAPNPQPRLILVATGNQDHICGLRVDSWSPLITMGSKSLWNRIGLFFLSRKENSNAISEYCVFISRILGGGDWCCVHYVMCEKLRSDTACPVKVKAA